MNFGIKFDQNGYFQSKTEKVNITIAFSKYHISALTDNFEFLDQICQKKYFRTKTEKVNIAIEFYIFELFLVPNLPKKYLQLKMKKVNIAIEFCIFELVCEPDFSLNWQCWFFRLNLPKKVISSQKQKKWTSPLNTPYSN